MTPEVPELLISGSEEVFFDWWFRDLGHDPAAWSADRIAAFVRAYRGTESLRAGFAHYRTLLADGAANRAWLDAGNKLSMPVLAVGGEYGIGDRLGRALGAVCRDPHSAVLPDSGHFLSEERPHELVEHLLAFFRG